MQPPRWSSDATRLVDEEREPVVLVEVEDLERKLRGSFAGQASRW